MPRALFALLLLAPLALADEPKKEEPKKEPSPFYTSWSKFKPGTSVSLKMAQTFGERTMDGSGTYTLAEVKKDGTLVFDVEYHRALDGKAEKPEKLKKEVGKSDDWFYPIALDPKTGKPKDFTEDGTEKVKVDSTEYECKCYKMNTKLPDGTTADGRLWVCDNFPGQLVKMTGKGEKLASNLTITAVTIKK